MAESDVEDAVRVRPRVEELGHGLQSLVLVTIQEHQHLKKKRNKMKKVQTRHTIGVQAEMSTRSV